MLSFKITCSSYVHTCWLVISFLELSEIYLAINCKGLNKLFEVTFFIISHICGDSTAPPLYNPLGAPVIALTSAALLSRGIRQLQDEQHFSSVLTVCIAAYCVLVMSAQLLLTFFDIYIYIVYLLSIRLSNRYIYTLLYIDSPHITLYFLLMSFNLII